MPFVSDWLMADCIAQRHFMRHLARRRCSLVCSHDGNDLVLLYLISSSFDRLASSSDISRSELLISVDIFYVSTGLVFKLLSYFRLEVSGVQRGVRTVRRPRPSTLGASQGPVFVKGW